MESIITPYSAGEAEFTEKRSRFIGHVWPAAAEEEALAFLEETRRRYGDSSHNVFAYHPLRGGERFSDDGEPQGTGGMPVLNVFRQSGVTGFCCVVTRYFGGVLLGAGGLVRAYSRGASMALGAAGLARMMQLLELSVRCTYPQFERLRAALAGFGAFSAGAEYGADVLMKISVPSENAQALAGAVTELTAGEAQIAELGTTYRPVKLEA